MQLHSADLLKHGIECVGVDQPIFLDVLPNTGEDSFSNNFAPGDPAQIQRVTAHFEAIDEAHLIADLKAANFKRLHVYDRKVLTSSTLDRVGDRCFVWAWHDGLP